MPRLFPRLSYAPAKDEVALSPGNSQNTRKAWTATKGKDSKKATAKSTDGEKDETKTRKRLSLLGNVSKRMSGVSLVSFLSAGFTGRGSQARRSDDLTLNQGFDAISLAKQHGFPISEVRKFAKHLSETQKDPRFSHDEVLNMDLFYSFLCKAFDLEAVDKAFFETSYDSFSKPGSLTLDEFLIWYKVNMFGLVNQATVDQKGWASESLSYELAAKHGVSPLRIDKIKRLFDRVQPRQRLGLLDFTEFQSLMREIMHADKDSLSDVRLKTFWIQMGGSSFPPTDFSEFLPLYLTAFRTHTTGSGLVEIFSEGYSACPNLLARPSSSPSPSMAKGLSS
eukprot:TRINITY_DN26244_c0_g1_i1.p1 TRINITY_DN26244_c0_g1~~TRINITY_DN26244_c0_g1_i1.p1  ORF type:complete len:337 (+),score=50.08 TRINITY_DN26244_c0_g1_i1:276-1286(+)